MPIATHGVPATALPACVRRSPGDLRRSAGGLRRSRCAAVSNVCSAIAGTLLPTVCLLDIGLPDINGNELVARLRRLDGMEQTLFIAVTGYGRKEDRELSLDAGFDHYFVKPLDTAALIAILA